MLLLSKRQPSALLDQKQTVEFKKYSNNNRTEWKFIPNGAPWFGDFWEHLIGLTKRTIKCTLGKVCISMNMLETIVTEIEGTMNNRPITFISTDIQDLTPLTPSHMLHGRRLDSLPDEVTLENSVISVNLHVKLNRNDQRQNKLLQHFRNRWKHKYLMSLREYHRTTGKNDQSILVGDIVLVHNDSSIQVGDIVLVHNDSNRIKWKLAIVRELISGRDGLVRSAVIKTENGITNRPIVKLFPLEVRNNENEPK